MTTSDVHSSESIVATRCSARLKFHIACPLWYLWTVGGGVRQGSGCDTACTLRAFHSGVTSCCERFTAAFRSLFRRRTNYDAIKTACFIHVDVWNSTVETVHSFGTQSLYVGGLYGELCEQSGLLCAVLFVTDGTHLPVALVFVRIANDTPQIRWRRRQGVIKRVATWRHSPDSLQPLFTVLSLALPPGGQGSIFTIISIRYIAGGWSGIKYAA